ncbi:hypothetical protein GTR04_5870 [Trichophyton interdigitale]|uniref:Uncharacterized protein n=1 Tax=Trichophyton interdigitale (strain MR816) TaxID=1215338 RepID=A0A059J1B9_TRIIM|nr:hypothetical protein GY631_6478 [Trichophyton interdigitale]KAG5218322.1 hypothetical protein GY632_5665 [Trichophyton interdigitale]KAG8206742.1 hypothetical protein GTR04_5870 [Trichophyton interdigitale]KDB21574.1 hypothetical protein H109_06494 [Trichophyton interdigitale MR816]
MSKFERNADMVAGDLLLNQLRPDNVYPDATAMFLNQRNTIVRDKAVGVYYDALRFIWYRALVWALPEKVDLGAKYGPT